MSLCETLLMALINSGKLIIRERNLSSFHRSSSIRIFSDKSHIHPEILPSCHEIGKIGVFGENRRIPEKICLLTPILQGGIAFFAVFSLGLRFSPKTARNGNKSVVLPDLRKRLGFSRKSLISQNDLMSSYGMNHDRMFYNKLHDLNFDLMSSKCVGFICYVLKKSEYSMFQINVYYLCRV